MTQFVASPEDLSRLTHIASGRDARCGADVPLPVGRCGWRFWRLSANGKRLATLRDA